MVQGEAFRLAGVMGWPIAHSLSPHLHGHWLKRYTIDGAYVPLPVRPEDLELAFKALPRLGFGGWNVTLPYKEAAWRLVAAHTPAAARMKAVNTVLVQSDGTLLGDNTDGNGFLASLDQQVPGWRGRVLRPDKPATAVVLGTGGAARAVAVALIDVGFTRLRLVNRTLAKAERLATELAQASPDAGIASFGWDAREAALEHADLLVQCTSLGMVGQAALDLPLAALPATAIVADLVYVPLETPLLRSARRRGHAVADGLGMLLHQAVPGFAHWGGMTPEVDATVRKVMMTALGNRTLA